MRSLFQLQNVQKRYPQRLVLDISHLEIHAGHCYRLTGHNGAGKSTLLNILAFLSPPSSGTISFSGDRVNWRSRTLLGLRQQVTLLHQSPYLFAGSVADNVTYGLKARRTPTDRHEQLVAEALASVGLDGWQKRPARQLSGGEAQRVALARALALKPQVLLLDEPLASVDRISGEVIRKVLQSLPSLGTTVIMATHEPPAADDSSADTIHLVDGKISSDGTSAGRNISCRPAA